MGMIKYLVLSRVFDHRCLEYGPGSQLRDKVTNMDVRSRSMIGAQARGIRGLQIWPGAEKGVEESSSILFLVVSRLKSLGRCADAALCS